MRGVLILKKRRSELDIIKNFLANVNDANGIKKTHYLHQLNTNFKVFTEYLDFLMDRGFIEMKMEENCNMYFITGEGSELLEAIEMIIDKLK